MSVKAGYPVILISFHILPELSTKAAKEHTAVSTGHIRRREVMSCRVFVSNQLFVYIFHRVQRNLVNLPQHGVGKILDGGETAVAFVG